MGSFAGTTALTATLSATATIAELLGASHPLNIVYASLSQLLGLGLDVNASSLLSYAVLLSLLTGIATAYYELVLPYLAPPRSVPSLWQIFSLTLLVFGLFGIVFLSSLFVLSEGLLDLWQQTGGLAMLLGIVLGVVGYASTVVYGRVLAVSLAPAPTVAHHRTP